MLFWIISNAAPRKKYESREVLCPQVLTTMMEQLCSKTAQFEASNRPPPPEIWVLRRSSPTSPTNFVPMMSSSLVGHLQSRTISAPHNCGSSGSKPILPHKWNLKFGEDRRGMFVIAELRRARNISKEVLLDSGIDLFKNRAYKFYQDCRNKVQSWEELD